MKWVIVRNNLSGDGPQFAAADGSWTSDVAHAETFEVTSPETLRLPDEAAGVAYLPAAQQMADEPWGEFTLVSDLATGDLVDLSADPYVTVEDYPSVEFEYEMVFNVTVETPGCVAVGYEIDQVGYPTNMMVPTLRQTVGAVVDDHEPVDVTVVTDGETRHVTVERNSFVVADETFRVDIRETASGSTFLKVVGKSGTISHVCVTDRETFDIHDWPEAFRVTPDMAPDGLLNVAVSSVLPHGSDRREETFDSRTVFGDVTTVVHHMDWNYRTRFVRNVDSADIQDLDYSSVSMQNGAVSAHVVAFQHPKGSLYLCVRQDVPADETGMAELWWGAQFFAGKPEMMLDQQGSPAGREFAIPFGDVPETVRHELYRQMLDFVSQEMAQSRYVDEHDGFTLVSAEELETGDRVVMDGDRHMDSSGNLLGHDVEGYVREIVDVTYAGEQVELQFDDGLSRHVDILHKLPTQRFCLTDVPLTDAGRERAIRIVKKVARESKTVAANIVDKRDASLSGDTTGNVAAVLHASITGRFTAQAVGAVAETFGADTRLGSTTVTITFESRTLKVNETDFTHVHVTQADGTTKTVQMPSNAVTSGDLLRYVKKLVNL